MGKLKLPYALVWWGKERKSWTEPRWSQGHFLRAPSSWDDAKWTYAGGYDPPKWGRRLSPNATHFGLSVVTIPTAQSSPNIEGACTSPLATGGLGCFLKPTHRKTRGTLCARRWFGGRARGQVSSGRIEVVEKHPNTQMPRMIKHDSVISRNAPPLQPFNSAGRA